MTEHRIFALKFSSVYPAYVNKATRKQRTQQEVDQIICWLTGYTAAGLQRDSTRSMFTRRPKTRSWRRPGHTDTAAPSYRSLPSSFPPES